MAAVLLDHVAAYAAQVRAHLADLSPEQVEDLTDGLEADLTEALEDPAHPTTGEIPLAGLRDGDGVPPADRGHALATPISNLTDRFGTPQAYAEELRAAAGLPAPKPVDEAAGPRPSVRARVGTWLRATRANLVARSWWPAARAIGEAFRPLWWVLRGWVLFNIVVTMVSGVEDVFFLPDNPFGILLLLVVVAASIQHGQGRWTLAGRAGYVLTAVSLVAAVGLLPVLATATAHANRVTYDGGGGYYYEPEPIADGVYFGGRAVTNLFVYDADGQFVDQAQIVDDKGRPVRVDREGGLWEEATGTSHYWSPAQDSYGREIWNAFPLRMWSDKDAEWDADLGWVLPDGVRPGATPPPFVQLAPLAKDQGDKDPSAPTDTPADTPTGTPEEPSDPASGGAVDPAAPPAPGDPAATDPASVEVTPPAEQAEQEAVPVG